LATGDRSLATLGFGVALALLFVLDFLLKGVVALFDVGKELGLLVKVFL
jgi:hypothetical protein